MREIFARPVLPDESQDDYDALKAVLLAELKPRSPYAELLADQLVELEWDLRRHRRLRDALLRAEFRHQAAVALDQQSSDLFMSFGPNTAARELAVGLVGTDTAKQQAALTELEEVGASPAEIMAKAYQKLARDLEPHERHIAEIEIRRRRLREDFDRVNTSPVQPIEEAQLVET
ncbi:hypothetical protein ACFQDR_23010 [Sulfitobacter sediminilitoris]